MKQSIQQKIFMFVLLPFLVIFIALTVFITRQIINTKTDQVLQQLKTLTVFSESDLRKFFETANLTLDTMAAGIESVNPENPNARMILRNILTAYFRSPSVQGNFLIFEPNAFDGNDAAYTLDYPLAPSGRFIAFYIRNADNDVELFPDIDENNLADPVRSFWYTIPKETGRLFVDLSGRFGLLRTDADGGPGNAFLLSMPVRRNGVIIGVSGLHAKIPGDFLTNKMMNSSVAAIFLPDGRLAYSPDTKRQDWGAGLEELGFSRTREILNAMSRRESILLEDTAGLFSAKYYSYFSPVFLQGEWLYIYSAIPRYYILSEIIPVISPILGSLLLCLISYSLLLVYLAWGISRPLQRLTAAAKDIVLGNYNLFIAVPRSEDELGIMTRSLSRIAEQFRIGRMMQERLQGRITMFLKIHNAMFKNDNLKKAYNAVLEAVAEYFSISRGSLVFIQKGKAIIYACYPQEETETGIEFIYHEQIASLLENRRHLTLNEGARAELKIPPFTEGASHESTCIMALRKKGALCGYVIMEGSNEKAFFYDDTSILFIADILGYLLTFRSDWNDAALFSPYEDSGEGSPKDILPERPAGGLFDRANAIADLDVEKGLLLIGGETEDYFTLLRITAKTIPAAAAKMRALYQSDLAAFAIEVHGIKGGLYSIAADKLGDEAKRLEFAAKASDLDFCRVQYPLLESRLIEFQRKLELLFEVKEEEPGTGNMEELLQALQKAKAACDQFDLSLAINVMKPFIPLKWDDTSIGEMLKHIFADFENIEYAAAAEKIKNIIALVERRETE
ncbi:MAG: HAMP domain-containing protein [Treponema sp.]|jgi:HPt (histidine-containing phosphotransfer) domain-containing protein/HAMP domain-containing protein|nr:HAMP domain-containing protein [Treponema sp.]